MKKDEQNGFTDENGQWVWAFEGVPVPEFCPNCGDHNGYCTDVYGAGVYDDEDDPTMERHIRTCGGRAVEVEDSPSLQDSYSIEEQRLAEDLHARDCHQDGVRESFGMEVADV